MSNQMITELNYNTEQTSLPLNIQTQEETCVSSKRKLRPTFIPYNNQQITFIADIQELISDHHVARVIDEMVEVIPDEQLFSYYKGGGRSSFHPKMMLKVILYGYSQKTYSCRGIEKMLEENIPAMWLAAMQKPDFRTLNDFRGQRMKSLMDELFEAMILKLIEDNYITMENYFLDGTKIEANANKYSFVWKKGTVKFEERLKEKIKETIQQIEEITELEATDDLQYNIQNSENLPTNLEVIAETLEDKVEVLSEEIKNEINPEVRKEIRQKRSLITKPLKLIRKDFLPRLAKYKEQNETFGTRNSYSKTDKDATFMRTKEDHMKNGQLKPCYNVQMATENQFILYYSIHQRPTDTRCFKEHLEKLASSTIPMPKVVIADAGYGSEENYLYAIGEEQKPRFEFLIPYGTYMKEQSRKYKNDISNAKNWDYNENDDTFICPNNRKVLFKKYLTKKNSSGYEQCYKIYESEDCTDCPLRSKCTKAKGNRQVHWNTIFEEMKAKAKAALECEEKAAIYSQRKIEVESVFGHIKGNRSFRRFSLRGLDKVHVEFGIVALAHNLLKVAGIRLATSNNQNPTKKQRKENIKFFFRCFTILGAF